MYSGDPLSKTDKQRLRFFAEQGILNWQFEYGQYIDGNLSVAEFPIEMHRATLNGQISEGVAFWEAWSAWRDQLRPDFVSWLEENAVNP